MGATQQGTDIFRRMEAAWTGSVQAAAGSGRAPPLLPPVVEVAEEVSGKKRNPKSPEAAAQPAKQRVIEVQPTVIQTQSTQMTQPASGSQVDAALAATQAMAAAKAAAKAQARASASQAASAAPEEREVSPTVAMSDGERAKRRGKGKTREELRGRDRERDKALARMATRRSDEDRERSRGRDRARAREKSPLDRKDSGGNRRGKKEDAERKAAANAAFQAMPDARSRLAEANPDPGATPVGGA